MSKVQENSFQVCRSWRVLTWAKDYWPACIGTQVISLCISALLHRIRYRFIYCSVPSCGAFPVFSTSDHNTSVTAAYLCGICIIWDTTTHLVWPVIWLHSSCHVTVFRSLKYKLRGIMWIDLWHLNGTCQDIPQKQWNGKKDLSWVFACSEFV